MVRTAELSRNSGAPPTCGTTADTNTATGMEKKIEAVGEDFEKGVKNLEEDVEERVEDGAKVALLDIYGPHPTLALVKFWQGVVELSARIAVIALSFAVLVAACVAISDVNFDTTGASDNVLDMVSASRSATGLMVFVSLFAMVTAAVLIVVRFLNFGAVNRYFLTFVIVDLLVVLTIGVLSFSGGVALGVSGEEWREQIETWEHQGVTISSQGYRIPRNLNATGAFSILTALALVFLGVWMVLYLVFDWNDHMPTVSVLAGVEKGVKKEVKDVLKKPQLKF